MAAEVIGDSVGVVVGGGGGGGLETQRSLPTPFLTKTYQLVENKEIDDVISWNEDGSSFVVWNPTVFARDLLPKYFKHNNFSSFVRQLNTYGFRKVVPDRWEFSNDCFRRSEKRLLREIQRRKISTAAAAAVAAVVGAPARVIISPENSGEEQQAMSSSSSPARGPAELVDENERLRKENLQLTKELAEMKSLCGNIFAMVSSFSCVQSDTGFREKVKKNSPVVDLMLRPPAPEGSPKLFGVTIGAKRSREEAEEQEQEQEKEREKEEHGKCGVDVKSEPLDVDHQEKPWLKQCHRANQRVCN